MSILYFCVVINNLIIYNVRIFFSSASVVSVLVVMPCTFQFHLYFIMRSERGTFSFFILPIFRFSSWCDIRSCMTAKSLAFFCSSLILVLVLESIFFVINASPYIVIGKLFCCLLAGDEFSTLQYFLIACRGCLVTIQRFCTFSYVSLNGGVKVVYASKRNKWLWVAANKIRVCSRGFFATCSRLFLYRLYFILLEERYS